MNGLSTPHGMLTGFYAAIYNDIAQYSGVPAAVFMHESLLAVK